MSEPEPKKEGGIDPEHYVKTIEGLQAKITALEEGQERESKKRRAATKAMKARTEKPKAKAKKEPEKKKEEGFFDWLMK